MGHASVRAINNFLNFHMILVKKVVENCEFFPLARQIKFLFYISEAKSSAISNLLHLDVWGLYKSQTFDGNRTFLTIMDDHSRMTWIYLLKLKSDVIIIIRTFLQMVQTQLSKIVKAIRTDNDTEFINTSWLTCFNHME